MPRGVYGNGVTHGQEWPKDVLETVQRELADGATYSEVLKSINKRHPSFHTTRNAIIGKANRMGWYSQNKMRNAQGVKDALEQRKKDPRVIVKPAKYVKEETTLLREDTRPDVAVNNGAVGFRRRTKEEIEVARKGHIPAIVESSPSASKPFADLKRDECKWPTALDASMACGRKATCGAYCDQHASIAYRTPPTRKRHATIGKEQDIDRARRLRIDAEAEATIEHFIGHGPSIVAGRILGGRRGDDVGSHVVGLIAEEIISNDD